MKSNAITKMELLSTIPKLPDQELREVDKFVKGILARLKIEQPRPVSLKGIWKNKGFERIPGLKRELRRVRTEITDAILKKEI